jgi:photosystem II stability/assembly factor-like uncharacterized protein
MKRLLLVALFFCSFIAAKAQYILLLSPNGGETVAIGSALSITWASIGINKIDIEYSSNNGATYTPIDTNVSATANSYTWLVTGPATSSALIRLKESSTGLLTDVSAATFNVVNPSLLINYPTAGLIFNPNQQVNIAWTGLIVGNNVSLFFSSDNGVNYDTIVLNTPNFYSFDWVVPSLASTTCKIKIVDAGAPAVQNISATFTIEALPSNATILTPNGGENLFSTTIYDITWNVNGTNVIDLEYSSDNGVSWQAIVQNYASNPANYAWQLPSLNSSAVKVRIKNSINGLVLDESNNVFTITQPTPVLFLSSPFGYENWTAGSTQNIQWTYSFITSIKIEYSTNGGNTFNLISANTAASDLSYDWLVPAALSSNCIIRITDNNSAITSQNQNPFNIVNPSITILAPNGGEIFNSNVDTIISWNGNLISNLVKIEYSTNNGTSWNLVANNVPNTNFFQWLVPNTPSSNCRVRISDAQFPAVTDQSNTAFTITPPTPTISLLSPNGLEQWGIGTNQTILWNSNNIVNVKIEYSTDSGITWNIINPLVQANLGNYTWLVDAIPSTNALIKVSDAANITVNDLSNNVFEFYTPSTFIDLLYPNGSDQIAAGINTDITWNAQGINNITIEYSINNGVSWHLIATGVLASTGFYSWNVPNLFSNFTKIRIRDEGNVALYDQSALFFSIIEPSISFSIFPAGATFGLFTNFVLYWTSVGVSNQLLKLEYSINNGTNWVTFATGVANTGSYTWSINCAPNSLCLFKISLENALAINDITIGGINVISSGPSIVVLTPLPQEILSAGSIYPIKWNSYGINYVRIEYSLNGDTIYQLITPFTPASSGLFNWNVPANINATNCNIRISNAANTNLFAQTPSSFNIQIGQFYMINGNFNSILLAGDNYQINWSQISTSNYVNLDYSLDSLNWNSITANYPNTGNYTWTVPYINADSVWFRVQDYSNLGIFDVNDVPQNILINDSSLTLNNPLDGAIILIGTTISITWNALGLNFIDIDFSNDNGSTWNTIATNVDAIVGSYPWNVPNSVSNSALIRVKNSNYPSQSDQNQTPFILSNSLLNIISPNGSEVWNTSTSYYITWQSLGFDFIDLLYSSDNGANYTIIDTNIYNLGYYNWQTPSVGGSSFKIKIVDSNNQFFFDESNANFSLSNISSSLILISPNGGEQLNSNSGAYISWQANGISNIDISYSLNGGLNYSTIANNIPSTPNYYYWLLPDTQAVAAKIKITSTSNNTVNDISNANFSIINDSSSLLLTYPNGGEMFNTQSYQTIKWSATNIPFVKLYYSINGGLSYNYINAVLNDSAYVWQVPTFVSNNCKIKIENGNDANQYDETNTIFTINNQPLSSNVILIDSLSSNNFCSGASLPISFTTSGAFNLTNNFRVHLSDFNGSFNNYTDIGGITANSNATIQCIIPNQIISGANYTIRIVADNPVAISSNYNYGNISISKANAEFTSDKQLVLFPNTLVNFMPNALLSQTVSSSWNTGNGGNYSTFTAQHLYSVAGKYNVTHTLTDASGCNATSTLQNFISVEHLFPNSSINTNTSENFIDIAFENQRYGCAIFNDGNCMTTSDSGKTWSISFTNSNNIALNSIFIFNNSWYIAQENGAYLKSTNKGNTWTQFSFNNTESLNDIYFISNNFALAAGNNGKLLKFNGTAWQNQNTSTNSNLNKIANKSNTTIIVGNNASILKQQNNLWIPIIAPVNVNFNSICLLDSSNGYIVGDYGFILKTIDAGLTWNVVLSGADVNFTDVIVSADSVWAVANDGIIYTSINNGNTWNRFNVGVSEDLKSITYINHKGFIVGNNGLLRTFNKPVFVPVVNQINENKSAFSIQCFPNPTSDKITLACTQNSDANFSVNIVNFQGKIMFQTKTNAILPYTIDLSDLPNGIYFLNVVSNEKHQSFKVIKTK